MRGNQIDRVSTSPITIDPSANTSTIDGGGRISMPGLIDVHFHIRRNLASFESNKIELTPSCVLTLCLLAQGGRVNSVAPGRFWTPLQPCGGQTQAKLQKFGSSVPMGSPDQPVEIAPVYVWVASQEGSYTTGEIYGVTGGEGIAKCRRSKY